MIRECSLPLSNKQMRKDIHNTQYEVKCMAIGQCADERLVPPAFVVYNDEIEHVSYFESNLFGGDVALSAFG